MNLVYFTHSLSSCWNHGNAHFLRGVLRELAARGCGVRAFEPEDAWSRRNLIRDHGEEAVELFAEHYPELSTRRFGPDSDLAEMLDGADAVIVHEWNEPSLVAAIGTHRKREGRYALLFHDTHHRAVSDPQAIARFDLSGYDGVLAFGRTLADVYRRWGWGDRAFVWHEAADTRLFHPPAAEAERSGLVWIGNWGDDERTGEIEEFLLRPSQQADLPLTIHGVRYPESGLALLERYGARYAGWLPNFAAPAAFATRIATVHVPRRFYVTMLPGIPTIRVFEALACGIPLASAPWDDCEHLFHPGEDFLVARDGDEMRKHLAALKHDPGLRRALAARGLSTIEARHTCRHRADELLRVLGVLKGVPAAELCS